MGKKRGDMKAVSGTFREAAAIVGNVLTPPEYKPLIEAETKAREDLQALEDKSRAVAAMTEEDFSSAISSRIAGEQRERQKLKAVYATPMKRYQAILDTLLSGEKLSQEDALFKADYEARMGHIEKTRWDVYLSFNKGE